MVYFTIKSVKKKADGQYSCAITQHADLDSAKKKFHWDLNETIGNAQFDYAMETLLNEVGMVEQREVWYEPQEEPEV